MRRTARVTKAAAAVIGLLLVPFVPTAADAARPPIGRTYFVVSLGLATDEAEAYQENVGCVRFTRTEICDSGNECGTWSFIDSSEKGNRQDSFEFQFSIIDDETGALVEIEGRADLDSRGRKSAIGGSATGFEPSTDRTLNFALGGRAVGPSKCQRLVDEYASEN